MKIALFAAILLLVVTGCARPTSATSGSGESPKTPEVTSKNSEQTETRRPDDHRTTIGLDKDFDIHYARDLICRSLVCRTKPEYMVESLEDAVTTEFQTNPACHNIVLVEHDKAQWWLVLHVGISATAKERHLGGVLDWKESSWLIAPSSDETDSVGGGLDDIHEALKDICQFVAGTGGTIENK